MKELTEKEQKMTFGGSSDYNNGQKLIYGIAKLYGSLKASADNFFDSFKQKQVDYLEASNVA